MHDRLYLVLFNYPTSTITEMKKKPHTVVFWGFLAYLRDRF